MRILVIVIACCCAFVAWAASTPTTSQVVPTYELYSWEQPAGDWNFCLLYTTDRQKTPEEVFSDKTALHGINRLESEVAKLPASSRIVWFDRLTLNGVRIRGSERLKYPPKEIVEQVKHYAEAHKIKVFTT